MRNRIVPMISSFYEVMAHIRLKDTRNEGVITCMATVNVTGGRIADKAAVAVHYDRDNPDIGLTVFWGDYALARKGLLDILNPSRCEMQLQGNNISIAMNEDLNVVISF
ncbi:MULTISPECIES: hypothetical protein [Pseudoalteromonas]|uniref:hypothetical protein n=1 Tax=Pseudoalteromonas TaxID=53246 RepID=UPI001020EF1C|nr:hypothetical protein [Pseudoalteromonas sp. MEBiC 03485]RZD19642.1 hypothetical protein EVU92_20795 [Pseudoalteromonas sp. MEBiC 03485]